MWPARPVRRRAVTSASAASAAASAVCFQARSPAACARRVLGHAVQHGEPAGRAEPSGRSPARAARRAGRRRRRRRGARRRAPAAGRGSGRSPGSARSARSRRRRRPASASIGAHPSSVVVSIATLRLPALCTAFHSGPARPQDVTAPVLDPHDGGAQLGQVLAGQRRRLVAEVEHDDIAQERQVPHGRDPRQALNRRRDSRRTTAERARTVRASASRSRQDDGDGDGETYLAGSSRNAARQPGPQNQYVTPSWSAWSDAATVATVMPHTGSTASPTAATGSGTTAGAGGRVAMISARIDTATSPGEWPPMSSPAGVCTRDRRLAQGGDHGGTAPAAGHQADVGHAGSQGRGQHVLLAATVRGHHDRRRALRHVARRRSSPPRSRPPPPPRPGPGRSGPRRRWRPAAAGSTGSRKISSVPPDRHGFTAVTWPGSSVAGDTLVGR